MTAPLKPNESPDGLAGQSLGAAPCSADDIVLEIKLPAPVKELAAIADALGRINGKDKLFMRQVGPMLQILNPRAASPPNVAAERPGANSTDERKTR